MTTHLTVVLVFCPAPVSPCRSTYVTTAIKTYAAGTLVPFGHKENVGSWWGRPSVHYPGHRPCLAADRHIVLAPGLLQVGNQLGGVGDGRCQRMEELGPVGLDRVPVHQLVDWPAAGHDHAPLEPCAGSPLPSYAPSIPYGFP